ncbi:MAG: aspartate dehydrogenase domain-containing protein [Betaproteobacteria bacterium]
MKKKIGLIGFGVIGKYIYEKLSREGFEFVFIFSRSGAAAGSVGDLFISSREEMFRRCASGVDLVVEVATSQAIVEFAPEILKYSDLAVFSSTAFADPAFEQLIGNICHQYQRKVYVPHGAILGVDGLFDGREVLQEVVITTVKRPENLGRKDASRTVLYDGPTREACKAFPRNVNVHACVALGGLGFDKTRSKIVSDPDSPGNSHLIEIKAEGCWFKIEVLSDPVSGVTGAYTPVSACASIRRLFSIEGIVIA